VDVADVDLVNTSYFCRSNSICHVSAELLVSEGGLVTVMGDGCDMLLMLYSLFCCVCCTLVGVRFGYFEIVTWIFLALPLRICFVKTLTRRK
jgi:1,4-dihydroxy-2-naphthoate octaprenyltransferase